MTMAAPRRRCDAALCDAAAEGDLRRVHKMLRGGVSPDSRDEEGTTALMAGAFAAHEAVVRALLAAGADPNIQDISGVTALMNAVIANGEMDLGGTHPIFLGIVEALLEAGAELDVVDEDGMTAVDHAESYDLVELVNLFDNLAPSEPTAI